MFRRLVYLFMPFLKMDKEKRIKIGVYFVGLFILLFLSGCVSEEARKAWENFWSGQYDEAIKYYQKMDPNESIGGISVGGYNRFILGMAYYKKGDYQQAIKYLTEAIESCKKVNFNCFNLGTLPAWYFWLGRAYYNIGQYEKAIENFSTAVSIADENPVPPFNTPDARRLFSSLVPPKSACLFWLGEAYSRNGQYQKAIETINKYLELDPKGSADAFAILAHSYLRIGEYDKAIVSAKKAIELDPQDTFGYMILALIQREIGQKSEAIKSFKKVIELTPNDPLPYTGMAAIYIEDHNYKAAIDLLKKALELKNDDLRALQLLSETYINAGNYGEAIDALNRIININNQIPTAFVLRAFAYRELGQKDAFLKDAEQAYSLNSNNKWAKSAKAVLLIDKGNYDQALKILSTVKGSDFDKVLEAIAYAKAGDLSNAVRIYQDIPEDYLQTKSKFRKSYIASLQNLLKPYKDSRLQVARDFERKGQYKEAIKEYAEYLKLADEKEAKEVRAHLAELMIRYPHLFTLPEEARKAVIRAEAYTSEGKFEKAIEEYKNALGLQPFFPALYKALALNYAQLKDYKKAIRNMNIYLELYPDAPDARVARDNIYRWEFLMEKGE